MITINKDTVNNIIFTLTERSQLGNPSYLFSFINDNDGTETLFNMVDQSGYPRRYNLFELEEVSSASTRPCQYAFAITTQTYAVTTTLDIGIDATLEAGEISSNDFIRLDYDIQQYRSGTLISSRSGSLSASQSTTESYNLSNPNFVCVITRTLVFDDGITTSTVELIEEKAGVVTRTDYGGITFPAEFLCDTAVIDIDMINPSAGIRTIAYEFVDGDNVTLQSGTTYSAPWEFSSNAIDMSWVFGIDTSEWIDLPAGFDPYSVGISWKPLTAIVPDPSNGQIILDYSWGDYNVYESVSPTLEISGTTGRIIETGRYFVNGYPVEFNNNSNANNIYL